MSKTEEQEILREEMFKLGGLLRLLMLEAKEKIHKISKDNNLSVQEIHLLRFLYSKKQILVNELANELDLSPSTISLRLKGLDKEKKLVNRVRLDSDARKVRITLTSEGKKIIDSIKETPMIFLMKSIKSLSELEIKLLIKVIAKIKEDMLNSSNIDSVPDTAQIMKDFLGF